MSSEIAAACCCVHEPCVPVGLIGSLRGLVTDIDCGLAPASGDTITVVQRWPYTRANANLGAERCCSWCLAGDCDSGDGFSKECNVCGRTTGDPDGELWPSVCRLGTTFYWRDLASPTADCVAGDPCPCPVPDPPNYECLGYWGSGECTYYDAPEGMGLLVPRPDITVQYRLQGCRWLWWTRPYSIGLDPMVPSSNSGTCNGLPGDQCPSTTACPTGCPTESHASVFCRCCHTAAPGPPCTCSVEYWSMGRSYPNDTSAGNPARKGGSSHIPWYPPSLTSEIACDFAGAGIWNTSTTACNIAGLSPYQLRLAQMVAPWCWEIVKFANSNPVTVKTRPGGTGPFTLHQSFFDTIGNRISIAGPIRNQPLFVRLLGWVGLEAHWRVCDGVYPDPTLIPGMPTLKDADQLPRTVPRGLGFTHDAVPYFIFQADSELSSAVADSMVEGFPTPTTGYTSAFAASVDPARAAIASALPYGSLDCKDWRGEIHADLTLLAAWGTSVGWGVAAALLDTYPTPAHLKPVGPVRIRGDWYDIRDPRIPATRPPALAQCDTLDASAGWWWLNDSAVSGAVGQWTQDACGTGPAYGGNLQTDAAIYTIASPPGLMPQDVANAWYRLTQSVYFRSMPVGWRVLSMSDPTTQQVVVDGVPVSVANGIYDAAGSTDYSISSHFWTQSTDVTDNTQYAVKHSWKTYSGDCPADPEFETARDYQWCANGIPYGIDETQKKALDLRCDCTGIEPPLPPPGICKGSSVSCSICDCQYGHPGIAGNPHVLVQRHCYPHITTATLCCSPLLEDNYCWARHSRRTATWDCSVVPHTMVAVAPSAHPIDRADYGCIVPAVQATCDSCHELTVPCDDPAAPGQLNYDCDCAASVTFPHRDYRAICTSDDPVTGMEAMYVATTHASVPSLPYGLATESIWSLAASSLKVPPVAAAGCP